MKRSASLARNLRPWLAAAAALPAIAWAASGQFTFVTGQVALVKSNGSRIVPARGTPVDPGDRIETGADGMAQLAMVDQARLSLRPSTQFVIEQYARDAAGEEGAVLSLVKGTLRAFTGLIVRRDRYVMKTRVASIGIRGSGNIVYSCDGAECDPSVAGEGGASGSITVNHTIEGAHAITNALAAGDRPPQQGGAQTLVTGPGQTVLVADAQPPRYIPTPRFIADVANNMTGAKGGAGTDAAAATGQTRDYSPGDIQALPPILQANVPLVGNNGLGFPTIDASGNLAADPANLRDIIIASGSPFAGQAAAGDITLADGQLRGFTPYAGTQSPVSPSIGGGTSRDFQSVAIDGVSVTLGRYENASLGFAGPGSGLVLPGSVHWIMAASGYPTFLSDVLTGSATYSLVAATSPTNQNNAAGTLGSASLNVNFSDRTLGFLATVAMPAQGANRGGLWQMSAENVPIALNAFFASTSDRLRIVNNEGRDSRTDANLGGSFEGSFVGTGLSGAIVGYGISDATASDPAHWNFITGVAAFSGPRQDAAAPYREGRVSDPRGDLASRLIGTYATTNRPDEVTADGEGRASAFAAPFALTGPYSRYSLGTAQVVQQGFDPETGMIWGRWAGGVAQVTRGTSTEPLALNNASLHYIFAGTQAGPVALPLTGSAVYDVIGSTSPTDAAGHVGTLGAASLNANFTNRTVDASVSIAINGQAWTGSANGMPIYRDQYFSAYSGTPVPGLPNPAPLVIGCQPACGQGATGSFDGFFTGRTGQRAGLMYRLGPNQGAIAFGRRGG